MEADRALIERAKDVARYPMANFTNAEFSRLLALASLGADVQGAREAAKVEGVRLGLAAALHQAATIRVALSGEQIAERREMLDVIRALNAEQIAEGN